MGFYLPVVVNPCVAWGAMRRSLFTLALLGMHIGRSLITHASHGVHIGAVFTHVSQEMRRSLVYVYIDNSREKR
ncbi:hypothetical protein R1sor_000977 [Riccia sorocarpa]|uniref:Secreted protein n=1 Tax=Riccia sorocarpa TaxID=122646 RepID=A0ABD3GXU4_9MARC